MKNKSNDCKSMGQWPSPPKAKGVQYLEKKVPGRPRKDSYYRISFQVNGIRFCYGLGWESEGVTLDKAIQKRKEHMENTKKGVKPRSPKEEVKLNQEKARLEEEKKRQEIRDRMTFTEFWEAYYFEHKDKKSWKHEENFYNNYIKPLIGNVPLKDISRLDLENLVKSVNGSNRNRQYCLAVVRQVFNRAIDLDLYKYANPIKKGISPAYNKQRKRTLTHEEEDRLLAALAEKSKLSHNLALMSLYTGMWFSEIARMKWRDIDWDKGKITVYLAKDPNNPDKIRYVYFSDKIRKMLQERYQKSKTDLVFPGKYKNVMKEVPRTFDRVANELGLNKDVNDSANKLVFYSLRHTFASRLMKRNVHDFTIMKLMGHSDIRMTKRYSHAKDDQLKEAVKQLEPKEGKVLPLESSK